MQQYLLGPELGCGAFSIVYEGKSRDIGEQYAVKIIDKTELYESELEAMTVEASILQKLNHPHVIRLYDVFDEKRYIYMVLEKMSGGELFDRIVQKQSYNEEDARRTCKIIMQAIKHCHDKKIAHRDLKPENLLLQVRPACGVLGGRRRVSHHFRFSALITTSTSN